MERNILSSRRSSEQELNLKEWHLRARISRENNTSSRRFSASYLRSFREENYSSRSFRSNFTISSTASSPGCYPLKDVIDPSTYSFTTALKALQGRTGYVWDCLSPEGGFALNSKWNEAERYICNPYSGEVPMECLSSKTLNGRSFRSYMASRVTMSAPLVYSLHPRLPLVKPHQQPLSQGVERHVGGNRTRDVGIQSRLAPTEGSPSSPSAISTPSIQEWCVNRCEDTEDQDKNGPNSTSSVKSNVIEEGTMQVNVKITSEKQETKSSTTKESLQNKKSRHHNKKGRLLLCVYISSWKNLLITRSRKYNCIRKGDNVTDDNLV